MRISYTEAKQKARKPREIWIRRFVCDPISTFVAYVLARVDTPPRIVTLVTFALGIAAAFSFLQGHLIQGALLYATSFFYDSVDGKVSRIEGKDDTFRGMLDFIADGIVCIALAMSLATRSSWLAFSLLSWMCLHYLDMRFTSATYRLKLQANDSSVWIVNESSTGLLQLVHKFIRKTGTYPIPSVGEAVIVIFVIGPIVGALTGLYNWMYLAVAIGILFTLPETLGAVYTTYKLAKSLDKGDLNDQNVPTT
jgi:phosphatidylglycerophosphate synthase